MSKDMLRRPPLADPFYRDASSQIMARGWSADTLFRKTRGRLSVGGAAARNADPALPAGGGQAPACAGLPGGAEQIYEAVGQYEVGKLDEKGVQQIECEACPGAGLCGGRRTRYQKLKGVGPAPG